MQHIKLKNCIIIIMLLFSYHRFSFPWYFFSWASGEPYHSGFKSQIVALTIWCVMFLAWWSFVESILNVVLVLLFLLFVFVGIVVWLLGVPEWIVTWNSVREWEVLVMSMSGKRGSTLRPSEKELPEWRSSALSQNYHWWKDINTFCRSCDASVSIVAGQAGFKAW
jgi:hypothetical protein